MENKKYKKPLLKDAAYNRTKRRKANLPIPHFNKNLPIFLKKDEIISSILRNRVLIIAGETGSGKTTQIPQFCLAAKRGINGIIGCTQPRRIAAVYVAKRIALELKTNIGEAVGYKIRFSDKTDKNTYIKVMTDGILLTELQTDKNLYQYDTIIVDEAHERSLNIDFTLGILKTLLKKRKDLKVIITSATIDTQKFSKAFDNAPVIEVSGTTFPVETRYMPSAKEDNADYVDMAVKAVNRIERESRFGDILIFMPTEADIKETCEKLEKKSETNFILPLYARLTGAKQASIFERFDKRKIIVATNIAETSITIEGIKYVIDTGFARILKYNPAAGISSLPIDRISKSSAKQRKGRCGRVENGICIRLYSEEDYNSRPLYTLPEILRSNLADVILKMLFLRLGDIYKFFFIDAPDPKRIRDGLKLLSDLGAIKQENKKNILTEKGAFMAKMPIDARLAAILIESFKTKSETEILIIVSALSGRDPKERPLEKTEQSDIAHKKFADTDSDFISYLNIWKRYNEAFENGKSKTQIRKAKEKFCKANFFSFKRMLEWENVHFQIKEMIKENRIRIKTKDYKQGNKKDKNFSDKYQAIHKALLSGFLSNIAVKKEKNIYKAAGDKEVMIFPGSALFNKAKEWVVSAEFVKTSALFARINGNIDPKWLEDLFADKCKYLYYSSHWEKKRGEVVAFEKVILNGLVIAEGRSVSYGRINSAESSEIFIRSALMEKDIQDTFGFLEHNKKLENNIIEIENRLRRKDIMVSEESIYDFYSKKIGNIYDIKSFKRFIKLEGGDAFLYMKQEDIQEKQPLSEELAKFPNWLQLDGKSLKYRYNFNVKKEDDGVTLQIPANKANFLNINRIDWIVPGFFTEKIEAMIKRLPKKYRKELIPISSFAKIITEEIKKDGRPLATALSDFIYKRFNVDIPASEWSEADLPDYLKMRVSVIDEKGKEIVATRDKSALNKTFKKADKADNFFYPKEKWEDLHNKNLINELGFEDISEKITLAKKNGSSRVFYPALTASNNNKKDLKLFLYSDKNISIKNHKKGIASLYEIHLAQDLKFLKKSIILKDKDIEKITFYFGGQKEFEKNIYESVIKRLFYKNIRKKEEFFIYLQELKKDIIIKGVEKLNFALLLIRAFYNANIQILNFEQRYNSYEILNFLSGLKKELYSLMPKNFLFLYDNKKIKELLCYVKTIEGRSLRGVENFYNYLEKEEKIIEYKKKLNTFIAELAELTTKEKRKEIEIFFWMLEEYKIFIFAQEIKRKTVISAKMLHSKIKEIERMI
ncbi:MAG: ATP-dependent RNA helicase HrpA [Deltaproteobacteria bacterium]|nr:ATP-dependent RNA helicase HrpA [Deltaproteobacteria bacterium]